MSKPTSTTSTTAPLPPTTLPPTTTTTAAPTRHVLDTGYRPFLDAQGLTLSFPTAHVEVVGFHQSNLAGARHLVPLPGITDTVVMPTRDRNTDPQSAADVESDPNGEVRAPVSGVIKRGGTYTLYCKYTDSFLVIAPDDHPGWEVKLLHVAGLDVRAGQRVVAGETKVAESPHRLPFVSDVEQYSVAPVWPHVHMEVDDPTIKNPPGVGGKPCA
ncbi:MAG TPA: hypothetical protein VHD87_14195 [Acidimicrobiales bacterium]|nr:hypothetical protein [Acidimicrobiales bacterium]